MEKTPTHLPFRNCLSAAGALLLRRTIFIRLGFAHVHSHRDLGYGAVWNIKSESNSHKTALPRVSSFKEKHLKNSGAREREIIFTFLFFPEILRTRCDVK